MLEDVNVYINPPVYSVFDVTEEVVDAFSQSFSPFLLLERLGDRKPSAESGLRRTNVHMHIILGDISEKEAFTLPHTHTQLATKNDVPVAEAETK